MAEIRRFGFARHLRAEPSSFVLRYRRGRLVRSGQGLGFWFLPMSAGVAEVPTEDREVSILFHGRSADFQDVTAQGIVTYRTVDPARLAQRVDFTIDLRTGAMLRQPLDRIALILTQIAQQSAHGLISQTSVRQIVQSGHDELRERILAALVAEAEIEELGLQVLSVRIASIRPSPDLEKALEAPAREAIQQQADEAAYGRRALAVEKERAIQENELQNRIELARREVQLIEQQGRNQMRAAEDSAAAEKIAVEGRAERDRILVGAEADLVRVKADSDAYRVKATGLANAECIAAIGKSRTANLASEMEIYGRMKPENLLGLAAHELAHKLQNIGHVTLAPEMLTPLLSRLVAAAPPKSGTEG